MAGHNSGDAGCHQELQSGSLGPHFHLQRVHRSPLVETCLYASNDVAVDAAGNLFIADTENHRIRKVDTSGTITTIAGTGETGL